MEGFGTRGNHRSRGGTPGGGSSIVFGTDDHTPRDPSPSPLPAATATSGGPVVVENASWDAASFPAFKLRAIQEVVNSATPEEMELALNASLKRMSLMKEDSHSTGNIFPEGNGQMTGGMEGVSRAPNGGPATSKAADALQKLKIILKKHGCHGIIGMGIRFRAMDDDGNRKLCFQEFKKAMQELVLEEEEIKELFRYFDKDLSGSIEFDELLEGLAPPPNPRRRSIILEAFKVFDADGSGQVNVQDLMLRYDTSQHPDVGSGKKTKQQVLRELLDAFDEGSKDGIVTSDEFLRYYQRVGASIDDDDYFELMVRNAWHISGGQGWCANTTCRRVLVTHPDGHQTVEEITNDIDIDKNDHEAMMAKLKSRGIDAVSIAVTGGPPPKSGATTPEPSPSSRTSTARGRAYLQSSIQF